MQSRRTLTLTSPFLKGRADLRWRRVRFTEQGSEKDVFWLSPRSERGADQGERPFRLHT